MANINDYKALMTVSYKATEVSLREIIALDPASALVCLAWTHARTHADERARSHANASVYDPMRRIRENDKHGLDVKIHKPTLHRRHLHPAIATQLKDPSSNLGAMQ
ncbi:unnamed protein product, partial [Iphiclides podalirius]